MWMKVYVYWVDMINLLQDLIVCSNFKHMPVIFLISCWSEEYNKGKHRLMEIWYSLMKRCICIFRMKFTSNPIGTKKVNSLPSQNLHFHTNLTPSLLIRLFYLCLDSIVSFHIMTLPLVNGRIILWEKMR